MHTKARSFKRHQAMLIVIRILSQTRKTQKNERVSYAKEFEDNLDDIFSLWHENAIDMIKIKIVEDWKF